ncbi:MAG: carotenoid 1,2-hydratase [Burkholderiales bacterium]|nr:carotenoid 1,2-hydratase [Burkholderiales bacterium]
MACMVLLSSVFSAFSVFQLWAFDAVRPGKKIEFPRDAGSHPNHRIEWWYVTGHLDTDKGPMGFQVTFFRLRNKQAEDNPSTFSPRQLLFAHAALADPAKKRLLSDQRSARMLPGLVEASESDTDVRIDDWSLVRAGKAYRARIEGESFAFDLELAPTQPAMPQGDAGFSRKGRSPTQASYYYSEPHLRVTGRVRSEGTMHDVHGIAWLDHEWSSELLAGEAQGWDWLGANLEGGAALMAFRIRGADGTALWAGATHRTADGSATSFGPTQVSFTPRRTWKSARTGAQYPVAMDISVGAMKWTIEPLMDDQELDARSSTGTVYWEGAVRVTGASAGRGYLELTGYAGKLRF